ncbi:isoprenylcysteine carboxyl methyltransferase family protein [Sulfoacidibacillus thermotolerans]|uniref:Isoprenylcysteine carboxyl methyltransferase n=1 Tax=Sulfoacidibacillus thermotolerans TaxID=1765684 RepID=A0A2U3D6H6_SULT2|nr:isoprenylcysteine carboxylmethyltransferase family protein [Sulfoacidibacillus thermotolerans]PWI56863.1 hypothetical protein BM613_11540 [Sulfoacidibacillus thermotolerans]
MYLHIAFAFLLFLALERILELRLAARNAARMRKSGAVEVGATQMRIFYALHSGFFLSLLSEIWYAKSAFHSLSIPFLLLFACAQWLRLWSILTLGDRWNVRVFVTPLEKPVTRGPYRYIRHPNYLAVTLEFISFPLIFHAYFTAVVFSLLNFAILRRRIALEETAWLQWTEYGEIMATRKRGFFWKKTL